MAKHAQKSRRYVGPTETVGYILFDASSRIPVTADNEFTDRILNIDKGVQAITTPIMALWDAINDLFVAAFVDKTRSRFGKFRPYLVLYPLYGLPMTLLVYLLPYVFWGTGSTFMPKIIAWAVLSMFNELTNTLASICRTGMIANVTPDPQERISLITKGHFFAFGDNLPKLIFPILRDIISLSGKYSPMVADQKLRGLFMGFGVGTLLVSGLFSLYFALVSKERVFGAESAREKPPTIRESLNALRHNRPLLMLMLADILEGINVRGQSSTYERSILNFANFGTISGIPGSPVSYASYAYVGKLRQRFSTKTLWIAADNIQKPVTILIFFYGMIKVRNPAKLAKGVTRNFMDLIPMLIAFGIENTVAMSLYGTKKVIPDEIRNECIDYGEWKSGFRSEGMTGALRGFPGKISKMFGDTMTNAVMKLVGFQTGRNYNQQTEKAAIGVFAMSTIIPTLFSLIALIPKFFFNISQKEREVMYVELAERRAAAAAALTAAHIE